jgi:hypothetical protein
MVFIGVSYNLLQLLDSSIDLSFFGSIKNAYQRQRRNYRDEK